MGEKDVVEISRGRIAREGGDKNGFGEDRKNFRGLIIVSGRCCAATIIGYFYSFIDPAIK